jgi:hypothetical protein
MIHERYRQDYDGEFVLVGTVLSTGGSVQKREWIDNPLQNQHLSHRAAVIAAEYRYGKFTHRRLENHRGGLLATKSLQTYGTGNLWTDMRFDLFLAEHEQISDAMISKDYQDHSVVYSTTGLCIRHPGCFYPVPYQPLLDPLAKILYIAAFDGHREIFMMGYRKDLPARTSGWINDVNEVIKTYAGTKFYLVDQAGVPDQWLHNRNFELMDVRRFVSHCDV